MEGNGSVGKSSEAHRELGIPSGLSYTKLKFGGLVVQWVTTSEYPLLYVFFEHLFWRAL